MTVTVQAGVSEVGKDRWAVVLLGDDVLDLEGAGVVRLGKSAVFAETPGTLLHFLCERIVHEG